MSKDILPKDTDEILPGRYEEANPETYKAPNIEDVSRPKSKNLTIAIILFGIISTGIFSYYIINQQEIDQEITQNLPSEQLLAQRYNVGNLGSDHAHAAIVIILDETQVNFGLPQFQLSSKYIHFENHNPYLIHKHATGVPLEMFFVSMGMEITKHCILVNYEFVNTAEKFCTGDKELSVYLNGEKYNSEISQYEINHNDRILVYFGDESVSKYLKYLESLEISDVPKKSLGNSNDIII
ncbi:MAG: hypothetical protein ISR80_06315 [Nitrosopumilus sp.]|nr:hypothetical protein [Candidatus Nitrosopelagicus sp.]MBL7002349.1 hypothetical protein [Nitrosopumilus sp.]